MLKNISKVSVGRINFLPILKKVVQNIVVCVFCLFERKSRDQLASRLKHNFYRDVEGGSIVNLVNGNIVNKCTNSYTMICIIGYFLYKWLLYCVQVLG